MRGVKVNKLNIFVLAVLGSVLVLLFYSGGLARAEATYVIQDNATGGDCLQIGTWDLASKKCTLNKDITNSGAHGIIVESSGITLDGNDHIITGGHVAGDGGYGMAQGIRTIDGLSDVVIENLTIRGFHTQVELVNCTRCIVRFVDIPDFSRAINVLGSNNEVYGNSIIASYVGVEGGRRGITVSGSENTIENNYIANIRNEAIYLTTGSNTNHNQIINNTVAYSSGYPDGVGIYVGHNTKFNNIEGNHITNMNWVAVCILASQSNTISSNWISNNENGIIIDFASIDNKVCQNQILNNKLGIKVYRASNNNIVYQNVFMGNNFNASVAGSTGNLFNLPIPIGGNYWSDFDELAEGCTDVSPADGFCDSPYNFSGGQDSLPWTVPNGWCFDPQLSLGRSDIYWPSMAAYTARHLSVDYHVDSFFDVYWDLNVEGTQNTNGVIGIGLSELGPLGVMINSTSPDFTYKYFVPEGVASFKTTVYATAQDACGNTYEYPGPWPGA